MVERVETWIDNNVLGDMLFDATYSDYKDFAGLKFPSRIMQTQGGYPILDLAVLDVKPNAPANIQAPQAQGGGGGQTGACDITEIGGRRFPDPSGVRGHGC